jgi:hypothetical protein
VANNIENLPTTKTAGNRSLKVIEQEKIWVCGKVSPLFPLPTFT